MYARVGDKMDELNSIVKCYFRIRTENINASLFGLILWAIGHRPGTTRT